MNSSAEPTPVPRKGRAWAEEAVVVLLLVLFVSFPRLMRLTADPVSDMHGHVLFDEGGWAHNARNHALFGQWLIDENNAALYAAPLYAAALAGIYAVAGVGLRETRLLGAGAGILTCLVVYAFLRPAYGRRRAVAASMVLASSYFMLTHNRVGFTESFQLLFILGAVGGILLAEKHPVWGLMAGVSFAAAMLAKPTAMVFGAVFAVFWLVRIRMQPSGARRLPVGAILSFGAGTLAVLIPVIVVYAVPHWAEIQRQLLGVTAATTFIPVNQGLDRMSPLGWSGWGLSMNGFFRQTVVPLTAVLLLALARLGRSARDSPDAAELMCWIWLVVSVLSLGVQQYQPDRRYLFLLPPLAYLAVLACRSGGALLPSREDIKAAGWLRRVALGGLLGGFLGLYLNSLVGPVIRRVLARLPGSIDLSVHDSRVLFWNVTLLGGSLIVSLWPGLFPGRRLRVPVAIILPAFLLLEPARFAAALLQPTYTIIEASRTMHRLESRLLAGRHVVEGNLAETLALETGFLTFFVRNIRSGITLNRDGLTRFQPVLQVVTQSLPLGRRGKSPPAPGFGPCREFELWPDRSGEPQWLAALYARPGYCPLPERP